MNSDVKVPEDYVRFEMRLEQNLSVLKFVSNKFVQSKKSSTLVGDFMSYEQTTTMDETKG
jgi:hypothetical protein